MKRCSMVSPGSSSAFRESTRRKILWAFGWRPALQESEVADAPTLEPMMLNDAPWPAQAAIRTDLGAIFVSLELSRRTWLITSLSPGAGEKMSKHSVPASDVPGLAASVCGTQAQGRGADRPGLPDHCHPGGRPGRLLDPPGAAVRRDREPRGRPRVNPDLAPKSAGEDRPDRWRDPGAYPDGLQTWRAAGVCDGQGADAAGGGPPACLPRASDSGGRAGEARQPDQRAALRPGGLRLRAAAQMSA